MIRIDDFLNPKSMVTPGIAGGVTLMISNTLWVQFALPKSWTALVISFLLGALVFSEKPPKDEASNVGIKLIYFVLNSLIIFSVAFSITQIGHQLFQP